MPALAILNDGSYLLLGKIGEDKLLVQAPLEPRPRQLTRQELEAIWGGRLVLMTKRRSLTDLGRRFDVTWFMGAIHKYRHRLAEVLLASFFLQLFGLVSPLFFQVVIDKVLVHRSISTLDILLIGLVASPVQGGGHLRTCGSRTPPTDDVDGASCSAICIPADRLLPVAPGRRSVARVRELENIHLPDWLGADTGNLFFTAVSSR